MRYGISDINPPPKFMRILPLVLIALLIVPAPAWSWGNEGHRLIGDIAEAALANTPNVMIRVRQIFGPGVRLRDLTVCADRIRDFVRDQGKNPIDPSCRPFVAKFSTPAGLLTRFAHSDRWHFINIPLDGHPHSMADVQSFCGPSLCAPERIEHYKDVLTRGTRPAIQAEAILFLTHLVGDLHQPLHNAERNRDAGGNLVLVQIFGQEFNLHHVWDNEIIIRMKTPQGVALPTEAARSQFLVESLPDPGPFNPWQWSLDAFQLAGAVSYVNDGMPIPDVRQLPGASLNSTTYLAAADTVTQQQLRLAGVRLAAILREKFNR